MRNNSICIYAQSIIFIAENLRKKNRYICDGAMKIISWNVNGLRACLSNGLIDYLLLTDADIIALQEIKVNEPVAELSLPGYTADWCFSARGGYSERSVRRSGGYSGTMCLYKVPPISVKHGLILQSSNGDEWLDDEGRIITLEYPEYFFVNVYVPNSQSKLSRRHYRMYWDYAFLNYIYKLNSGKPVIIGGDFNVAHQHIDVFPENVRNVKKPYGFLEQERDGFNRLLEIGMADVFRVLYPAAEAYTWWSQRFSKRDANQGWRIDYFVLSDKLLPKVKNCVIRSDVHGSDHAPMEMRIDVADSSKKIKICNNIPIKEIKQPVPKYTQGWSSIDWKEIKATVRELQKDIAVAVDERDYKKTAEAQERLLESTEAKLLAVWQVCSAKSQPGIDREKWTTDKEKWDAATSLNKGEYKARPMRRIKFVPNGDSKIRDIQIPTYYDRAMQTLYAYSLAPVAETTGDRNSFSGRAGRSLADVHSYIMRSFQTQPPPSHVIKADVQSFYGSISHRWLMDNIPMDKHVLREFIDAGYIFRGELFPSDGVGISLGSPISPVLANMVLDGLQTAIYRHLNGPRNPYKLIDYANGNLVRFADDVLITATSIDGAMKIFDALQIFLQARGLRLSYEKTKIINVTEGFDFAKRRYEYVKGVFSARPSDIAVQNLKEWLNRKITPYKGGQLELINMINRKLRGFANYHKITDAKEAFHSIDCCVEALLLHLTKKRYKRMSKNAIVETFFLKTHDGERVYILRGKPDVHVLRLKEILLTEHKIVATKKNPYIDRRYFEYRTHEKQIEAVTGRYKQIWLRQGGVCFFCGKKIIVDDDKCIVVIDPALPENWRNLAYVHTYCRDGEFELYQIDDTERSTFDLHNLLARLSEGKTLDTKTNKFTPLKEFFRRCTELNLRLKFDEVAAILGKPLCKTALNTVGYWNGKEIRQCWLSNGYELSDVDLVKCVLTFRQKMDVGVALSIPEAILRGRVPEDAKEEILLFIQHVVKRYDIDTQVF